MICGLCVGLVRRERHLHTIVLDDHYIITMLVEDGWIIRSVGAKPFEQPDVWDALTTGSGSRTVHASGPSGGRMRANTPSTTPGGPVRRSRGRDG